MIYENYNNCQNAGSWIPVIVRSNYFLKLFREASWHPAFIQCILLENSNNAHARRDFADACKAMDKKNVMVYKASVARQALELIGKIYQADEKLKA